MRLPAGIAAVAIATAIAVATAPAATTIATVIAGGLGLGLVYANRTPVERLSVERVNRRLRLIVIRHLNEAESL